MSQPCAFSSAQGWPCKHSKVSTGNPNILLRLCAPSWSHHWKKNKNKKNKTTPKVQMFLSNIIFLEGVASSRSHRTLPGKQTSWLYRYEADLIGLEASGHWNQFDGVFFCFFFYHFYYFCHGSIRMANSLNSLTKTSDGVGVWHVVFLLSVSHI